MYLAVRWGGPRWEAWISDTAKEVVDFNFQFMQPGMSSPLFPGLEVEIQDRPSPMDAFKSEEEMQSKFDQLRYIANQQDLSARRLWWVRAEVGWLP